MALLCAVPQVHARATDPPGASIERLLDSGRFVAAERLARERLALAERARDPDSLQMADLLDSVVIAMRRGGKAGDPETRLLCDRAIGIKTARLGPDHPETAVSLALLGLILYETNELDEARSVLRRVLDIRERALGPDVPRVAQTLTYLAAVEGQAGNDSTAKQLVERAIQIQRAKLPPDHPDLGQSLNMLASLAFFEGDFARAKPLYEQVLAIYLKRFGPGNSRLTEPYHNLGAVDAELGEPEEARRYLEQALAMRRRTMGRKHPLTASTLVTLGSALEGMGDAAGARARYEAALPIQQRGYGAQHPDVAWALTLLGRLDLKAGRYSKAETLLNRALAIQDRAVGGIATDASWSLWTLANVEAAEGRPERARTHFERALALMEHAYGRVHPDRIRMLIDYAHFLARTGDSTLALDAALNSSVDRIQQLRTVTRGLAERQALTYRAFGSAGLDLAVDLASRGVAGADGVRRAWDAVVRSRTVVLDEMASRQQIAAGAAKDSALAATVRAVDEARRLYAGLLVRGARDGTQERFRERLDRAQAGMERAERDLAAGSLPFRTEEARLRMGLGEVLAALPPDGALVSFAVNDTGSAKSYIAFVTRSGLEPRALVLGRTAAIDGLIDRWVGEIARAPESDRAASARRAEALCRRYGEALRRKIWDPIAAELGGAARVFLVPDGALYRVSFTALPVDHDQYLVESGPILHTLTSERDLLPETRRPARGNGLLAVGGPLFDRGDGDRGGDASPRALRGIAAARRTSSVSRGPLPDCADFRAIRFDPLPGSAREVEEIARLWPDSGSAVVLTGARASEPGLKALAPGRRVLHLATHGFFLDGTHCTVAAGRRGIGGLVTKSGKPPPAAVVRAASGARVGNPLRLSGLALAGANLRDKAPSGDEDGILTAEEVAAIDLTGTDWAVLSACDTGIGRVQAGEGVLGLRRAFRVAGARTVLMSLWAVDDLATRRWMSALYQARFRRGLGTAEAVRAASLEVLREQRAQARSTHPFYWAGFVAAGDWK